MRKFTTRIDSSLCRACGICVELCPKGVLKAVPPLRKAQVAEPDKCTGCLLCQELCPDWAVDVIEGGASD